MDTRVRAHEQDFGALLYEAAVGPLPDAEEDLSQ